MSGVTGAGDLSERVSIVKRSGSPDGQGGRSTTWVDLVTGTAAGIPNLWASVMPIRMGERLQAASIGSLLSYRVVMRYRSDITPAMRVSWRPYKAAAAKTLEIHGVQPYQGGHAFIQLDCAEVI